MGLGLGLGKNPMSVCTLDESVVVPESSAADGVLESAGTVLTIEVAAAVVGIDPSATFFSRLTRIFFISSS